ncbi:MAG: 4Fe-4S binding protein [Magnetococcus sp. DMHC-6]
MTSLFMRFFIGACLCFFLPIDLFAHGPGRSVRLETGYCGIHPDSLERTLSLTAEQKKTELPFCLRLINLEAFPLAVRLRVLPGTTLADGMDVCSLIPDGEEKYYQGVFKKEDQTCKELSLVLEAGATQNISGQWSYHPPNPDPSGEGRMVRCLFVDGLPLDINGDLHQSGVHIKGQRKLHMTRIVGNLTHITDATPPKTDAEICNPVPPLLSRLEAEQKQKSLQNSSMMPPMVPTTIAKKEMTHPGLPMPWLWCAGVGLALVALWGSVRPLPQKTESMTIPMTRLPILGGLTRLFMKTPWPFIVLKIIAVLLFIEVIWTGWAGTQQAGQNLATVLVWNYWWPLVIISVLLVGTGWCAICPWDTLATALVWTRLFRSPKGFIGLTWKVPGWLRNIYPALFLLLGLTWIELGGEATRYPWLTASMALILLGLAILSLLVFERKAFCRYFCPVGRTLGAYARLSPVAIRPLEQHRCDACTRLACFHGTPQASSCPTHLTIGRFSQNTYCISCGHCIFSCPEKNVTWHLRSMGEEAAMVSRPAWDGAWFMLVLLGLTLFHGFSMTANWEIFLTSIALTIGERGSLGISFALGMGILILMPIGLYGLTVHVMRKNWNPGGGYRTRFATLAFATLPLAFVYHLSHNLAHIFRESTDLWPLLWNPLGHQMAGMNHMAMMMNHMTMMNHMQSLSIASMGMYTVQTVLVVLGGYLSMRIVRFRVGMGLAQEQKGWQIWPMTLFGLSISSVSLWLLSQEMVMRF